jgi:apolipoprotein D and lipocalin family protein
MKAVVALVFVILLAGCTSLPENIQPVSNFDKARYLGTWYEIVRLDHSFERGLNNVTATYSLREDGGINVLNKGYNPNTQTWKEAEGKAYFVGDENTGHLKVSFFGPFYASYVVAALDENYQYALITGPNTEYLWILSRTPQLSEELIDSLLNQARQAGFATEDVIVVTHN